jgi:copper homeostasis protein
MPRTPRILLEIVATNLDEALAAERAGADRIELCERLVVGGVTPSLELIDAVLAAIRIPVVVMLRPRGGDFLTTPDDRRLIERQLEALASRRVAGVVFGGLTGGGSVDVPLCRMVVERCGGRQSVFHRAFDAT